MNSYKKKKAEALQRHSESSKAWMSVVIGTVKQEDNLDDSLKGSEQSKNLRSMQKVVWMWNKF